jgi:hypothetical protein
VKRVRAAPLLLGVACLAALDAADAYTRSRYPRAVFGAIAVKPGTETFGYAYDFPTSRAAHVEALRECGDETCEVLVGFRNGCGAAAFTRERHKVIAVEGATRAEAEAKALRKCGADCEVLAWACTK